MTDNDLKKVQQWGIHIMKNALECFQYVCLKIFNNVCEERLRWANMSERPQWCSLRWIVVWFQNLLENLTVLTAD